MASAARQLRIAANLFAVSLLLVATTAEGHGGLQLEAEDISKTIKSNNGVVVDCVYIQKQPTLKHPLFKDHKIEVYKKNMARYINRRSDINYSMPLPSPNVKPLEQEWHRSGSCPEGTIPIRRVLNTTIAPELPAGGWFHHNPVIIMEDSDSKTPRNEFAVAYGLDGPYHGASALLPLLRPTKLDPNEATITSILISSTVNRDWITQHPRGDFPPDSTNQISVGLVASTSIYGNDDPNLFVYYTADGGKSYCLNLDCPGFIQTSNRIALGTSFINGGSSITYNGVPYVSMSIHRVPGQQQWWVTVNDTVIGYFPHTLFPTFFPESFLNQVGGIVYNSRANGVHTNTVMGNGRLPDNGDPAIVKAYLAVAEDWTDRKDNPINFGVTAPKCYNIAVLGENLDVPGYDIAYGGPGGSGCDQ